MGRTARISESTLNTGTVSNRLLSRLSRGDFEFLAPHLTPTLLPARHVLEVPDKPITHVCFIEAGFASVMAGVAHHQIEVGIIGREGVTGLAVILGALRSPNTTLVQSEGHGLSVAAGVMRQAIERRPTLRRALGLYNHAFHVQVTQAALANGRTRIAQRLARWLLMAHDRIDGDDVCITHEHLRLMLGVRRASVTLALSELEARGLVAVQRGAIRILRREKLEKATAGTYGVPEAEFHRLFG